MPFQPGQSGNPSGRPKLPDDVKQVKLMDSIQFQRILHSLMWAPDRDVQETIENPDVGILEKAIAAVLIRARAGDYLCLNLILNRAFGRVPEKIQVEGDVPVTLTHQAVFKMIEDLNREIKK